MFTSWSGRDGAPVFTDWGHEENPCDTHDLMKLRSAVVGHEENVSQFVEGRTSWRRIESLRVMSGALMVGWR